MKYKLNKSEHSCLVEALRRFECFHVRDPHKKMKWNLGNLCIPSIGLGYLSSYKQAVKNGYMIPSGTPPEPRCAGWFMLTEKGAKIVLHWHKMGFKCGKSGDPSVNGIPADYAVYPEPPQQEM